MAKIITDDRHYKAIATELRDNYAADDTAVFKPSQMAPAIVQNIGRAYDAGRKDEYDSFWDMFQQNGKRTAYNYGFADWGWEYARPKYKVLAPDDYLCFLFSYNVNLKKVEAAYFDLSTNKYMSDTNLMQGNQRTFGNCSALEEVEDIGLQAAYYYRTFYKCPKLHTIAVLRFRPTTLIYDAFNSCTSLANLRIEGTIGQDGLDLHWSAPLTKMSLESVVGALSESATGKTVTLPLAAVKREFETAPGANDGDTAPDWLALKATRANWNITLN